MSRYKSKLASDELNAKLKSFIFDEMAVDSLIKDKADWTRTDISYEGMIFEIKRNIWGCTQGKFPKSSADPMEIAQRANIKARKVLENNLGIICWSLGLWNGLNQMICENYGTKATQPDEGPYVSKPKPEPVVEVGTTTRLLITSQYTVTEETVVEVPVGYTAEDVKEVYVKWGKSALGMSDDQLVTDLNVIYKRETHDDFQHPEWISVNAVEENEDGTFDFDNQVEVISGNK